MSTVSEYRSTGAPRVRAIQLPFVCDERPLHSSATSHIKETNAETEVVIFASRLRLSLVSFSRSPLLQPSHTRLVNGRPLRKPRLGRPLCQPPQNLLIPPGKQRHPPVPCPSRRRRHKHQTRSNQRRRQLRWKEQDTLQKPPARRPPHVIGRHLLLALAFAASEGEGPKRHKVKRQRRAKATR